MLLYASETVTSTTQRGQVAIQMIADHVREAASCHDSLGALPLRTDWRCLPIANPEDDMQNHR